MTTRGFSNPLPDEGPFAPSSSSTQPLPDAAAPLPTPTHPRGTSPHSKYEIKEMYKMQDTIASFNAPSQSSLKGSFRHQYLPNSTPEIPSYVIDDRNQGSVATARNAALNTGEHNRGATLGEWLQTTRRNGPSIVSGSNPSPFISGPTASNATSSTSTATNPRLAALRSGDDNSALHPALSHPGLQRKRLEEELAAHERATELAIKDALILQETELAESGATEGSKRGQVRHRDFREEVIAAVTEEFYDPATGGLKANTGSATASEQAIRAKLFDRNAGFAFRSSAGSTSDGDQSCAMNRNMVLDRGVEEAMIASRRKAALGIGELGIREKIKKLEQEEREYEDELTPQGRDEYRKAKLEAAQLAGKNERDAAKAKERRLRALSGDDDNSSFDRLRAASRIAESKLAMQGLDSEVPNIIEGPPPTSHKTLPTSSSTSALPPSKSSTPDPLQPQLHRRVEQPKTRSLPFADEYATEEGDSSYSSSPEDISSSASHNQHHQQPSQSTSNVSVPQGISDMHTPAAHEDGEEEMATQLDLMSPVRATKQYPVATSVPKQFSFHDPTERPLSPGDYLASFDPVPNNTPVPEAPMWTSSLSVPLRARRILEDNWRNPQTSSGEVPEPTVQAFQKWMEDVCPKLKEDEVFTKNIVVKPRQMYTKGLYARRRFKKGEIIATMPVVQYQTEADGVQTQRSPFGSHLTIESLLRGSAAVKERRVPSFADMHYVFTKKATATRDTEMHPLFEEQLYLAMLVACEKDAADKRAVNGGGDGDTPPSAFGPYFDTIAALSVDDEYVRELHRDHIEPHQSLEYMDHEGRTGSYIRRIQKHWPDAPHFDTIQWAFRFVLSRQRMLPLRDDFADERKDAQSNPSIQEALHKGRVDEVWGGGPGMGVSQVEEASLDWLSRFQRWARETALSAILPASAVKAAEEAKLANERRVVPTIVPLVDMFMHDFKGEGTVEMEQIKTNSPSPKIEGDTTTTAATTPSSRVVSKGYSFLGDGLMSSEERAEELRLQSQPPSAETPRDDFTLVIRASRDMEVGEELTMVYPKCYSVSYTLYKYGFLALRPRAVDTRVVKQQWGDEGNTFRTPFPSSHPNTQLRGDTPTAARLPMPTPPSCSDPDATPCYRR